MTTPFDNSPLRLHDYVMTENLPQLQDASPFTLGQIARVASPLVYDVYLVASRAMVRNVHREQMIHLHFTGSEGKQCNTFENDGRVVYWDGQEFQSTADACDKTYWNPAAIDRTNARQVQRAMSGLGTREMRDVFISKGWPTRDNQGHLLTLPAMRKMYKQKGLEDVRLTMNLCDQAVNQAQQVCTRMDTQCSMIEKTCNKMEPPSYKNLWSSKQANCRKVAQKCREQKGKCDWSLEPPPSIEKLKQELRDALVCHQQDPENIEDPRCKSLDQIKQDVNFMNSSCVVGMREGAKAFAKTPHA
jgi:hypothetical protein